MKSQSSTPLLRKILAPSLGLVVAVIFFMMASLYKQTFEEQQRAVQIERVAEIRANIEGAFNGATNLTAGLVAFVSSTGEISQEFFDQLSQSLIEQNQLIRNITLAPDNVIRYVYPLAGNEAALGLDLLNHPTQGEATKVMIDSGSPVLAGPYNLVQGGVGVIHRVPIFLNADFGTQYWGLMSTPIDFTALLDLSGINDPKLDLTIALRSLEGTGADGVIFWGEEAVFNHPNALHTYINVLNGRWEIAAIADEDLPLVGQRLILSVKLIGGIFALLTTFMIWQILRMNERLHSSQLQYRQLAQHDSLTGLPNRILLSDRFEQAVARAERNRENLVLLYMDLDGFKRINDDHGHQIGDLALAEIAKRFRNTIRGSDSVVRMGGDEFIVLLENVHNVDSVLTISDKLLKSVSQPIEINSLEFTLGMSIGVACFPNDGLTLDQLITAADHAMYQAKTAGKNQISWSSDPNIYFAR
ncbi:MAG: sensor domain-containing diguanylate cyclase [Oceanospirillales bacterium]|nr:MAG: sensor domain-containing diguanylate cyclase [Oceanospirillales bacterium]